MCRTVHALLSTAICGIQMLVRVFMTIILMLENLIRMILQTLYNFISFMLQLMSLVPICVVFLLTARLKCFMCGGGGPCPVNRGGTCDCLMSAVAIVILFLIFRATGVLDKIFYKIGYVKARPLVFKRFVPTPGSITECSRETLSTTTTGEPFGLGEEETSTLPDEETPAFAKEDPTTVPEEPEEVEPPRRMMFRTKKMSVTPERALLEIDENVGDSEVTEPVTKAVHHEDGIEKARKDVNAALGSDSNWTTVLYYLV